MKNIIEIIKNHWWLIFIGLWVLYSVFFSADRDQTGNVTKSGWVNVNELEVGDCTLDNDLVDKLEAEDDINYQYWVTPCEQEHSTEVFYKYDLRDDFTDFPGRQSFLDMVSEVCHPAFEIYVRLSIDEMNLNYSSEIEKLGIGVFYPLEESWYTHGYKFLDCFVYNTNGELMTGSVKNQF